MRQINEKEKLTIVVDESLSKGQQLCQSAHALTEFAIEHREIFEAWQKGSNYLCCLSTSYDNLIELSNSINLEKSIFKEPYYNNRITALCVEPTTHVEHNKLYNKLKLTLS